MFGSRKTFGRAEGPEGRQPFIAAFRTEDAGVMVKIDPAQIASPAAAGIILVDIMRHLARAMTQYGTANSEAEATASMLALFKAEVENPTDLGSGSIVN